MLQIAGPFLRGGEVAIARLIDPQAMRFEIGGHCRMRHGQFLPCAQMGDDLRRQEVRVDDQVPRFLLEKLQKHLEVELFQAEPELVAPALGGGPIEQIVKVAEHVRGHVDQIEIELAIEPAKEPVGHFQHVVIFHVGVGHHFSQGDLDSLGGTHMTCTNGCGQDQNARCHGR